MKNTSFVFLPLLLLSGCATIMHGTNETVGISSNPTNAAVWVDNQYIGQSPTIVKMSRKDNHIIKIELDGYQPYEATLTRQLSGWVFGNIVFGGFIGLAVDAISGGLYQLTPGQIQAEMRKNNLVFGQNSDESFIAIVMQPDASWQKIGNLTCAN